MALSRVSSLLGALSLLFLWPARRAGAAEYTVGGGVNSWDTGTDFAVWAQKYTFTVGDILVFQYVKSQHNVYEVTESAYRSCDGSAGRLGIHTSGYDKIALKEAKNYWFICDVPGHCLGGMRLAVNVSAAATGGGTAPKASMPPSSNAASPAGGGLRSWCVLVLAFGVCLV